MATASNTSGKVQLTGLSGLGYNVQWNGSGKPITVSKGGQTYSVDPSQYTIGSDNHAYVDPSVMANITGFQPVRSTLEGTGNQVGWNPQTGQVTAANPYGTEGQAFTPQALWGGKAYADPATLAALNKELAGPFQATASNIQNQFGQYSANQQGLWNQFSSQQQAQFDKYYTNQSNQINGFLSQMNQYAQQFGAQGQALLSAYQQHFSQALSQLQQLMNPDPTVPASVKTALNILQQKTQESIQQNNEDMNARGIYSSGLAEAMQGKIQTGELNAQEQILGNWLDQVHNQVFQATMQYAQDEANFAGQYANLENNVNQGMLQQEENIAKEGLGAQQQLGQEAYQFQSGLGKEGYQTQSQLASQGFDLASKLQQWVGTEEAALAKAQQDWNYKNAGLQLRQESIDSTNAYRNAEIQIRNLMAQIAAEKAGGSGATPTDTKLAGAVSTLQGMFDGVNSLYTSNPTAFAQQYPNAADPSSVITNYIASHQSDYLNSGVSPTTLTSMMNAYMASQGYATAPAGSPTGTVPNISNIGGGTAAGWQGLWSFLTAGGSLK